MNRLSFSHRFYALFLCLSLSFSLPRPVFALRTTEPFEVHGTLSGLEEALSAGLEEVVVLHPEDPKSGGIYKEVWGESATVSDSFARLSTYLDGLPPGQPVFLELVPRDGAEANEFLALGLQPLLDGETLIRRLKEEPMTDDGNGWFPDVQGENVILLKGVPAGFSIAGQPHRVSVRLVLTGRLKFSSPELRARFKSILGVLRFGSPEEKRGVSREDFISEVDYHLLNTKKSLQMDCPLVLRDGENKTDFLSNTQGMVSVSLDPGKIVTVERLRQLEEIRVRRERQERMEREAGERRRLAEKLALAFMEEDAVLRRLLQDRMDSLQQNVGRYLDPDRVAWIRSEISDFSAKPIIEEILPQEGEAENEPEKFRQTVQERLRERSKKIEKEIQDLPAKPVSSSALVLAAAALTADFSELRAPTPEGDISDQPERITAWNRKIFGNSHVQKAGWSPAQVALALRGFREMKEAVSKKLPGFRLEMLVVLQDSSRKPGTVSLLVPDHKAGVLAWNLPEFSPEAPESLRSMFVGHLGECVLLDDPDPEIVKGAQVQALQVLQRLAQPSKKDLINSDPFDPFLGRLAIKMADGFSGHLWLEAPPFPVPDGMRPAFERFWSSGVYGPIMLALVSDWLAFFIAEERPELLGAITRSVEEDVDRMDPALVRWSSQLSELRQGGATPMELKTLLAADKGSLVNKSVRGLPKERFFNSKDYRQKWISWLREPFQLGIRQLHFLTRFESVLRRLETLGHPVDPEIFKRIKVMRGEVLETIARNDEILPRGAVGSEKGVDWGKVSRQTGDYYRQLLDPVNGLKFRPQAGLEERKFPEPVRKSQHEFQTLPHHKTFLNRDLAQEDIVENVLPALVERNAQKLVTFALLGVSTGEEAARFWHWGRNWLNKHHPDFQLKIIAVERNSGLVMAGKERFRGKSPFVYEIDKTMERRDSEIETKVQEFARGIVKTVQRDASLIRKRKSIRWISRDMTDPALLKMLARRANVIFSNTASVYIPEIIGEPSPRLQMWKTLAQSKAWIVTTDDVLIPASQGVRQVYSYPLAMSPLEPREDKSGYYVSPPPSTAAGLEELKILAEAMPSGQVLAVQASEVSKRVGLEEFLARLPVREGIKKVIFGAGSLIGAELQARSDVLYINSNKPADWGAALAGLEEENVLFLGDAQAGELLGRMLPASIRVRTVAPGAGLEQILFQMGLPMKLLKDINSAGLEEQFARARAA